MTRQGFGILAITGGAAALLSLSGCYTQLGTFRDSRDRDYSSEEYQESEEYGDSVSEDEYAEARQKFYDESYSPYITIGYDYTWGSPMYRFGYPWYVYGSPWYYDPFYGFYGGYMPWYAYGGHHAYGGGYVSARSREPNTTRRIGTNRTFGGTRGTVDYGRTTPAYVPLPAGVRSDKSGTSGGAPVPTGRRPAVSTGRRGAGPERMPPAGVTPPADRSGTSQGTSRPAQETPRPVPVPDSGRRSTGGSRSPERPAYTPPPPAPPPSNQPAPSGGNRGGENRGGGGGGTRGGGRR